MSKCDFPKFTLYEIQNNYNFTCLINQRKLHLI